MISETPKPFIFVHIPKCAGTSIEQILLQFATPYKTFREIPGPVRNKYWLPGGRGLQHSKLRRYAKHFDVKNYFKFAIVRNPWDRAVSQIQYLRSKAGHNAIPGVTFKEQVRFYCTATKTVWGHDLKACQFDYVSDGAGSIGADFVGRFETLEQDFGLVCQALGINPVPRLPHVFNSKRARHYSAFFDDESAGWINTRFAQDAERFRYSFEAQRGVAAQQEASGDQNGGLAPTTAAVETGRG